MKINRSRLRLPDGKAGEVETSLKTNYPMNLISYIVKNTQLSLKGIENTVALLNEDCTVPFISRYRKERTGNLDEVQIGYIVQYKSQFEALEKRKLAILKSIEEQEELSPELSKKINDAEDLTTLEDLYLPFKKKRKTKAETAKKNGLEPLAQIILAQRTDEIDFEASKYINDAVPNEDEALLLLRKKTMRKPKNLGTILNGANRLIGVHHIDYWPSCEPKMKVLFVSKLKLTKRKPSPIWSIGSLKVTIAQLPIFKWPYRMPIRGCYSPPFPMKF